LRAYNAAKCDCGRGSAPDPGGRAYRVPPAPSADFKGALRGGEGEGERIEGQGGREGREEVDSDAQLEQGRRLAKAGPALLLLC